MTPEQQKVKEFMMLAGQDCPGLPTMPDRMIRDLRDMLIKEELKELKEAETLVQVADALADLKYVVEGAAVAYGIDLQPIFDEVHKSNMTKFIDGYRAASGKWMKGKSYVPPNLASLLDAQSRKWDPKLMSEERYNALMKNPELDFTDQEVKDGWHYCFEFDGLLRTNKEEEFKCTCMDTPEES